MDRIQFDGSEIVLRLYPSDCATLAQILTVADAALVAKADRSLKEAANSYAAFFRALELGALTHANVMPWNFGAMDLDLARPQPFR